MNHYLEKTVTVKVTNPLGSKLNTNQIYLHNLGLLDGMIAHILGIYTPIKEFKGKVIGVIKSEVNQLIIATEINDYSKDQIISLLSYLIDFDKYKLVTLEYLSPHIRNSVRALIKNEHNYLFVKESYLKDDYYHLVGGGMNFLEKPEDTLRRELDEELGAKLINYNFITTISNIFSVKDIKAHEMMHLYACEIDKYIINGSFMTADIYKSELVWLSKNDILKFKDIILPKKVTEVILGLLG